MALRHWIQIEKLDIEYLALNPHPSAIYILEQNSKKVILSD